MNKHAFVALAVAAVLVAPQTEAAAGTALSRNPAIEGAGSWLSGDYTFDGTGNIIAIGDDVYVYDSVGRLVSGTARGAANQQKYSYDSFGNRLYADTTGAPCVGTVTCGGVTKVDWTTNRLHDPAQYDAAGNLRQYDPKFDPSSAVPPKPFVYVYDGAGMISNITAPDGVRYEYVYAADDERLATNTNGGSWRFTVRDVGGNVIREVNAYVGSTGTTWLWDRDHVFRGASLLASVSTSGTEQFHLDHLETPRIVTDSSGGRLAEHAYYPFGGELDLSTREAPEERLKFTGHERDAVGSGGLDYMRARYYSLISGGFLTPDPIVDSKRAMPMPQLWNRYLYVADNPLNRIDPDGRLIRLLGNADDQKKELELIKANLRAQDQKYVTTDKNGLIKVDPKAKGGLGLMMLKQLASRDVKMVTVRLGTTFQEKSGPGPTPPLTLDIQAAGGGGATVRPAYSMSGDIEVNVDPRGGLSSGAPASLVMGHELLGHGWDLAIKGKSSERSAVTTETDLLLDLGLPPFRPVPHDRDH